MVEWKIRVYLFIFSVEIFSDKTLSMSLALYTFQGFYESVWEVASQPWQCSTGKFFNDTLRKW